MKIVSKLLLAVALAAASASALSAELTLYTSRKQPMIQPVLDAYTKTTGTTFKIVADGEAPLIERMKREPGAADIFWTQDGASLDRAANLGLLEPFKSKALEQNIPADLRDKNGFWYGMSVRTRIVVYNDDTVNPAELSTYEDLANPKWKGKLCMRTSTKVYNQALVGWLIRNDGLQKAEQVVKGWVANLAAPVFNDDTLLVKAVDEGQCQIALVNAHYYFAYAKTKPDTEVRVFYPNQKSTGAHVNLTGLAVANGSSNVGEAQKFIEWLSTPAAQSLYSHNVFEFPANPKAKADDIIARYGKFKRDSFLIGGSDYYQVQATKLSDRVGYK